MYCFSIIYTLRIVSFTCADFILTMLELLVGLFAFFVFAHFWIVLLASKDDGNSKIQDSTNKAEEESIKDDLRKGTVLVLFGTVTKNRKGARTNSLRGSTGRASLQESWTLQRLTRMCSRQRTLSLASLLLCRHGLMVPTTSV